MKYAEITGTPIVQLTAYKPPTFGEVLLEIKNRRICVIPDGELHPFDRDYIDALLAPHGCRLGVFDCISLTVTIEPLT